MNPKDGLRSLILADFLIFPAGGTANSHWRTNFAADALAPRDQKILCDHRDLDAPVVVNFLRKFRLLAPAEPRRDPK